MDRAETVRLLAEVFQTEGYSDRWRTLMDSIREHGPLHNADWLVCADCGDEFAEREHELRHSNRDRCDDCWHRHKTAKPRDHGRHRDWYR